MCVGGGIVLPWASTAHQVNNRQEGLLQEPGDGLSLYLPLTPVPYFLQSLQRRETEVYACMKEETGSPVFSQSPATKVCPGAGDPGAWFLLSYLLTHGYAM